ncbi:hypothetical protein EVAR_84294_1 [Eumeta japonica]|uniref:Uncharacterized protein n=1 Tax=Eumeta variegata TaxID=151549 RepID=A0A4C1WR02_EUMVA|nr:hypothetical protein EVAR_84294_1 [Eumeta japonica]
MRRADVTRIQISATSRREYPATTRGLSYVRQQAALADCTDPSASASDHLTADWCGAARAQRSKWSNSARFLGFPLVTSVHFHEITRPDCKKAGEKMLRIKGNKVRSDGRRLGSRIRVSVLTDSGTALRSPSSDWSPRNGGPNSTHARIMT